MTALVWIPLIVPPALGVAAATHRRASWARLDGIGATWVLVGHGDPWDRGVAEALREARAR